MKKLVTLILACLLVCISVVNTDAKTTYCWYSGDFMHYPSADHSGYTTGYTLTKKKLKISGKIEKCTRYKPSWGLTWDYRHGSADVPTKMVYKSKMNFPISKSCKYYRIIGDSVADTEAVRISRSTFKTVYSVCFNDPYDHEYSYSMVTKNGYVTKFVIDDRY